MCVGAALKPFVIPCQTVPECIVCVRLNCKPSKQLILRRWRRVRPFRLIKISSAHHQHRQNYTHAHVGCRQLYFTAPTVFTGAAAAIMPPPYIASDNFSNARQPALQFALFRAQATTPFGVISPELSHRRLISSYFKEDASGVNAGMCFAAPRTQFSFQRWGFDDVRGGGHGAWGQVCEGRYATG